MKLQLVRKSCRVFQNGRADIHDNTATVGQAQQGRIECSKSGLTDF
jgi:hypothetical protein